MSLGILGCLYSINYTVPYLPNMLDTQYLPTEEVEVSLDVDDAQHGEDEGVEDDRGQDLVAQHAPLPVRVDEPLVVQDEDVSVGDYGDGDQSVDRAGEVGQHFVEEANLSKKKRSLTF